MKTTQLKTEFVIVKQWSDHPGSNWITHRKIFQSIESAEAERQKLFDAGWMHVSIRKLAPVEA